MQIKLLVIAFCLLAFSHYAQAAFPFVARGTTATIEKPDSSDQRRHPVHFEHHGRRKDNLPLIGLLCGTVGFGLFNILGSIAAIILGSIALKNNTEHDNLATADIIIGGVEITVIVGLILVLLQLSLMH